MIENSCVMIVDDEEINREMLRFMIADHCGRILLASNGKEAVDLFTAEKDMDLILMDLEMHSMNGLEATTQIRSIEASRGGHIPIIAITAHDIHEESGHCFAAGMDAFISKPFRGEAILETIGRLLTGCVTTGATAGNVPVATQALAIDTPKEYQTAIFDLTGLQDRVGCREDHILSYIELFMEEVDHDLPALEQAIVRGDKTAIAAHSHSLKGIACNIGANRMYAIGSRLDSAVKGGETATLLKYVGQMQEEYELFKIEAGALTAAFHK